MANESGTESRYQHLTIEEGSKRRKGHGKTKETMAMTTTDWRRDFPRRPAARTIGNGIADISVSMIGETVACTPIVASTRLHRNRLTDPARGSPFQTFKL